MRFLNWLEGQKKRPSRVVEVIEHLPHGRIRVRMLEGGKQIGKPAIIMTVPPSAAYFSVPHAQ
jgi:hypothetical protein